MTDGTAQGGVISKEIKRIFQRVGEIVTWSETKLMIGNQAIGEEEGFNI